MCICEWQCVYVCARALVRACARVRALSGYDCMIYMSVGLENGDSPITPLKIHQNLKLHAHPDTLHGTTPVSSVPIYTVTCVTQCCIFLITASTARS